MGFAILWGMGFSSIRNYVIEAEHKSAIVNINTQVSELEALLLEGKYQLVEMSKQNYIKDLDWQEIKPEVELRLKDSVFQKIGLVYPDATYHITGTNKKGDLSDRQYVSRAFNTGDIVVSSPLYSKSDEAYQVVVAVPIYENTSINGLIIGTILMEDIEELISKLKINGHGYGFLCEPFGEVYTEQKEILSKDLCLRLSEELVKNKDGGYLHYKDNDDNKKIAFYTSLREADWGIVITVDEGVIYRPVVELFTNSAISLIIVLILLILAMSTGIKIFLKQIRKLIEDMQKVEEGNYMLQVEINRNNEISDIAQQFNKTVEAICLRDEELQALNEELAASSEEIMQTNQKLVWAHEEIASNLQRQKLINQLGEILYSVTDNETLVETILVHTQEMVQADKSTLFLYDKEDHSFKVKSSLNYTEEEVSHMNFPADKGTFQWMLENKTDLFIPNVFEDERYVVRFHEDEKFKVLLQIPIFNDNNDVIGIISYRAYNINLGYIPFLKQISKMVSIALQNSQLINQIEDTYFEVIVALIKGMELKDSYMKGHSERVMKYSLALGNKIDLSNDQLNILRYGSILHDIGKMGVSDDIVLKKAALTPEEYQLIKEHPQKGEELIKGLKFLRDSLPIVRNHHERYDGLGYPDGLKGNDIPILARIVSIADAYDAMTSFRAYRSAINKDKAIAELKNNSGTQFDPYLVDLFIQVLHSNNL